jgi:DMSO/TMAO reductase YedYZ heme-binding membrane subunit
MALRMLIVNFVIQSLQGNKQKLFQLFNQITHCNTTTTFEFLIMICLCVKSEVYIKKKTVTFSTIL